MGSTGNAESKVREGAGTKAATRGWRAALVEMLIILALYVAYHARGWAAFQHARVDAALESFERAAAHARRAGQPHELLGWRGPTSNRRAHTRRWP